MNNSRFGSSPSRLSRFIEKVTITKISIAILLLILIIKQVSHFNSSSLTVSSRFSILNVESDKNITVESMSGPLTGRFALLEIRKKKMESNYTYLDANYSPEKSLLFSGVDEILPWKVPKNGKLAADLPELNFALANPLMLISPQLIESVPSLTQISVSNFQFSDITIKPATRTVEMTMYLDAKLKNQLTATDVGNARLIFNTFNAADLGFQTAMISTGESNGIVIDKSVGEMPIPLMAAFGPISCGVGDAQQACNSLQISTPLPAISFSAIPANLAVKLFHSPFKEYAGQEADLIFIINFK